MSIAPVSLKLADQDFEAFADALGAAFERYGFAVVADHGLDDALVEGAIDRAKAFFALPEAVKRQYRVEGGAGQRGYTPFGVETAKGAKLHDLKEFWHVGRTLPPGHAYRALHAAQPVAHRDRGLPRVRRRALRRARRRGYAAPAGYRPPPAPRRSLL